ncbi:uncharacterized [Tachysurus ichikawai]
MSNFVRKKKSPHPTSHKESTSKVQLVRKPLGRSRTRSRFPFCGCALDLFPASAQVLARTLSECGPPCLFKNGRNRAALEGGALATSWQHATVCYSLPLSLPSNRIPSLTLMAKVIPSLQGFETQRDLTP